MATAHQIRTKPRGAVLIIILVCFVFAAAMFAVLGRQSLAQRRETDRQVWTAQAQWIAHVEEVQLLGPPRSGRRSRQAFAIGQGVEQRALADVRSARESNFGNGRLGQKLEFGGGL